TPHRGPIVDRHGEALALSLDVPSVFVRPREFGRQDARLAVLAAALHLPLRTVRSRTARAERFVWLERQVPPREAEAVEQLGLKGVYTVQEGRRFYPHHGLAAHVLGFVGVDSQGLEGLERRLDPVIRGQPRDVEADRDGRRQVIFTAGVPVPPAQGSRVELTIDAGIQYSSNIGATKVAERLGAERYYRYLRAFGFGARTGIELPGESPGIVRPVEAWARIDLATLSFGQGVSVTPLQMAAAFAAIAN